jgi:murein L,D-transpeptidase YafK
VGTLHGGVFRLKRHTGFVRTLMASASIAFAVALAGCQTDDLAQTGRAMQPLSRDMQALIEKKGMSVESPMLVRLFKEESELELWKQDKSGQFALLKTYPICRWSGDLGPKVKQGDRQAPEGFYTITPGQMNPNSKYYLAFNLGFPNTFDKAHDRNGAFLMVHGDCSSAGCYSMSDDQMAEIYALGREAFLGGQKSFQVQAFPFRMTALNLAKHRNSPHLAFWKMIKEGSDHFEVTRQEPKVDVCDRRYVFNATAVGGTFNSRGSCPSYRVPDQIAASVKDKRERDERQFVALVSNGTQTVSSSGSDGGMHPVFVAKLQPHTVIDTTGRPAAYTRPGSGLPTLVRLPRALESGSTPGRAALTQVASADPSQPVVAQSAQGEQKSGNFFTRLFSGTQASEANKDAAKKDASSGAGSAKAQAKSAPAKVAATPSNGTVRSTSSQSTSASKPETAKDEPKRKVASSGARAKPVASELPGSASAFAGNSANGSQAMTGAQPVLPASSFDARFGGLR